MRQIYNRTTNQCVIGYYGVLFSVNSEINWD